MLIAIAERWRSEGGASGGRLAAWRLLAQSVRQAHEASPDVRLPALLPCLDRICPQDRADALQDLLAEHLRQSWKNGRRPKLEDCWSDLKSEPAAAGWVLSPPAELLLDEFLARYQQPHGDCPGLAEFQARFPRSPDALSLIAERFAGGGRHVRLHLLGCGAMGEVWEAWDHKLQKPVALKRLDPLAASEDLRQRLHREFQMAARLRHPGIIRVFDFHDDKDGPFFTMKLMPGTSLSQAIRLHHQPPPDRTAREQDESWRQLGEIFLRVCEAAAAAHAQGVIHRDLKPANVLLGDEGDAAIIDWGLAVDSQSPANHGELAGTPEYMAPEQFEGRADERSDVFGLGAILYEMLAGKPPRTAAGKTELRQQTIAIPQITAASAPKALSAVCQKALAMQPDDRFASAERLASASRSAMKTNRGRWQRLWKR